MIDLGIDVFQGCMTTNNVPELVKKYGGKISFMGDLDNGVLDRRIGQKSRFKRKLNGHADKTANCTTFHALLWAVRPAFIREFTMQFQRKKTR